MKTTYKIYCLKDPNTNEIRYIGQTSMSLKRRLYLHLYRINDRSHKNSWIKSLGIDPLIECLETCNDQDVANELEIFWIKKLRAAGIKLTNMTDGGNVTTGYKFSEEQKRKMRGRTPWNKGTNLNEVYKNKISTSVKNYLANNVRVGTAHTDVSKMKISEQNSKGVLQYINGIFVREWSSITEAAQHLNISKPNISRVCKGSRKTAGGFIWKYKTVI